MNNSHFAAIRKTLEDHERHTDRSVTTRAADGSIAPTVTTTVPPLVSDWIAAALVKQQNAITTIRNTDRRILPKQARILVVAPNAAIDIYREGTSYIGGALGTIASLLAAQAIPAIPLGFLGAGPVGDLFQIMAIQHQIETGYLTHVAQDAGVTLYASRMVKAIRYRPRVTQQEINALLSAFHDVVKECDPDNPPLILLSGSIPEAHDTDITTLYQHLIRILREVQSRQERRSLVWLDARGPSLLAALESRPDYVKINRSELTELMAMLRARTPAWKFTNPARTTVEAVARDAKNLISTFGLPELTITMDKRGALTAYANTNRVLWARLRRAVPKPFIAGLGDTLFTTQAIGEVTGHRQHRSLEHGVAAARVSAMRPGTSVISDLSDLYAHLPDLRRQVLDITDALRPPQSMRELQRAMKRQNLRPVLVTDMDGTLTMPGSIISASMLNCILDALAADLTVVILTSSGIERTDAQVLTRLRTHAQPQQMKNLYAFTDQGSQAYTITPHGKPKQLFLLDLADPRILGPSRVEQVRAIIKHTATYFQIPVDSESLISDHVSQLTVMVLGRDATNDAKCAYDQKGGKAHRARIASYLNERFAEEHLAVSARPAGLSSINIGPSWIDKAFGIEKIAEVIGVAPAHMIYVADEFWPGGVDAPVLGHVLASINVGPALRMNNAEKYALINDVPLGTTGTEAVLTVLATMCRTLCNTTTLEIAA